MRVNGKIFKQFKRLKVLFIAIFLVLLISPAWAFVTVPGDYLTIEAALVAATLESDKLVLVDAGTYTGSGNGYDIDWPNVSGLTLRGAGSTETIISGESLGRVINIASVLDLTIEGLTIRDGYVNSGVKGGAGISLVDGTNIELNYVIFSNCSVSTGLEGGAIYVDSASSTTIEANYCLFEGNSAVESGGAIWGGYLFISERCEELC